jgi:hypothetical protein
MIQQLGEEEEEEIRKAEGMDEIKQQTLISVKGRW